ncbi:Ubiquinone biosynthesis O-methyltransferase, mitochondrial [Paraconexibacter sp. AEG42_29]|uniref:Ubiquinone biosynthesis O-methyltransferase, mitochondrial n=1 Tax=Paraconexibacter sp. AEG42_29 TaxID=2997339 RepID=A0AAU7AW72_9ACTN
MPIAERAAALGWYHVLELAPGVVTPGMFDLRGSEHHYHLPEDMTGMRALEVGTWDGFWAFEMERRGATVVAIDLDDERELDWPPRRRPTEWPERARGAGFALASEVYESKVERVICSVYDMTPEKLGGQFDLVFCGSVLIHLRDQLLALERIAELTKPGGTFISAEEYDPWLSRLPVALSRYHADRDAAVVFWMPSVRTWKAMLWTAGFDTVVEKERFKMQATGDFSVRHVVLHGTKKR